MKRISIFIGLKIAEILGVGFIFTGGSAFGNILPFTWEEGRDIIWTDSIGSFIVCGIGGVGAVIVTVVILFILYLGAEAIIKKNWEWAGRK